MTKRNVFLTLGSAVVAAATIAVAVPALSHGPGPDGDRQAWGEHHFDKVAEKLGLNDKQKATLKTLKDEHMTEVQSIQEQVRAKREAMKSLWLAPNPDKAQLIAAEREVNALEGQIGEARVEFLFKARGVLTPEQFGKFVEMRKGEGMRGHWGKHDGHNFERRGLPDEDGGEQ